MVSADTTRFERESVAGETLERFRQHAVQVDWKPFEKDMRWTIEFHDRAVVFESEIRRYVTQVEAVPRETQKSTRSEFGLTPPLAGGVNNAREGDVNGSTIGTEKLRVLHVPAGIGCWLRGQVFGENIFDASLWAVVTIEIGEGKAAIASW